MIDDSYTMAEHWHEVKELARLLTYIVKKTDDDGVELYFLSSQKCDKCKDASAIERAIRDHTPSAHTNLDSRLNQDLSSYGKELERPSRSSTLFRHKELKKRSIYVFTDGILATGDPTQGQQAIKLIVEKVLGAGLLRGQVGIQLISFGNDPDGLAKLQNLDRLNQDLGLGL